MINNAYPFEQTKFSSYRFVSVGRKQILKEVAFAHTGQKNVVNMGFGDVMPDGTIDDMANSNNGDITKYARTFHAIYANCAYILPHI